MDSNEIGNRLKQIASDLKSHPFCIFHSFERNGRFLHVCLTERLRKTSKKEGVWLSKEFCNTLKNAAYGFDETQTRSNGGSDGIFLLDRDYKPPNEMMRKLFDRFIDKPNSGFQEISQELDATSTELLPVRLVSHALRLLGVLYQGEDGDWLVLVDSDRTKN